VLRLVLLVMKLAGQGADASGLALGSQEMGGMSVVDRGGMEAGESRSIAG